MNLPSDFEIYTRNLLGDALYSRLREGLAEAPSPTSIRLNPFKAASREVNGQLMESVVNTYRRGLRRCAFNYIGQCEGLRAWDG